MRPPGAHEDLVIAALKEPARVHAWDAARWSLLFRQARAAGLLGRIAGLLDDKAAKADDRAPGDAAMQRHADGARRVTRAQQAEIRREVRFLQRALEPAGVPVLLLKGAAYVMAGLPAAEGRIFSDIDILVRKSALADVESSLMLAGWMTTHHNAYDQRYYREWMHELPPMEHVHRHTVLDVHHTILPETGRLHPDAAAFFADAVALPGLADVKVLCPADMVLHSMTHLFMNDDMNHALRDLSDLDLLLRRFGPEAAFWPELVRRARMHRLQRPLYYGLRYTARLLGTPVPEATQSAIAPDGPTAPLRAFMDAIWMRVLRTSHPSATLPGRTAAIFALYLRGHWLRMPPLLLMRHLAIKALRLNEREADRAAH